MFSNDDLYFAALTSSFVILMRREARGEQANTEAVKVIQSSAVAETQIARVVRCGPRAQTICEAILGPIVVGKTRTLFV